MAKLPHAPAPPWQGEHTPTVQLGPGAPPVRPVPPALARRFHQICAAIIADTVADADLSALQFAVFPYLSEGTGEPGIDQNGIAARLGIDRNNTSLLLDQLESKGLVERRVNGADRRARMLYLTPKGEKLYARLYRPTRVANDRILAPLAPNERALFLDMLIRLIKGNFIHARPGAGRRKRRASQSTSVKPKGEHDA
jgi:DNA-binding MarR family transcriptional regulator